MLLDIFRKQSPLSAAQFEAAFRSHPKCQVAKLSFVHSLKNAGNARLAPWVRLGLVTKVEQFNHVLYRLSDTFSKMTQNA